MKRQMNWARRLVGYALVAGLTVTTVIGETDVVNVSGDSMHPMIADGSQVYVMKAITNKEGQIVIAGKDDEVYIKRIYGTEGDCIQLKDNNVIINNSLVKKLEGNNKDFEYVLKTGEYFLLGDNPKTEYIITDTIYYRVEGVKN